VDVAKIGVPEISSKEIGALQKRAAQGGPVQICSLKNSAFQVRTAEISSLQVHSCQIALLQGGPLPLISIKSTNHARQGQFTQVHPAQVSPPQVQTHPLPLSYVAPIDRSAPLLVPHQQPLHISAAKPDIFEGINTLTYIRLYAKTPREEFLPFNINLHLATPRMTNAGYSMVCKCR